MTEVVLNVYDVTNTQSDATNDSIVRLNNVTRPLGLGGVFHGGVELNNQEWSFGYCDRGTGVYSCRPKANPMYSYRETVDLGKTPKTHAEIKDILRKLRSEWQGSSYDLLARNCCHFCEILCKELEVKPPPGWVNRFAVGADATVTFTNEAVSTLKNWGMTIQSTTTTSFNWMRDAWTRTVQTPTPPSTPPSNQAETGFSPLIQQKPSWSWQIANPRPQSNTPPGAIPAAHAVHSQPTASFSSVAPVTGIMPISTPVAGVVPSSHIADSEVSLLGPEMPMTSSGNSFVSAQSVHLTNVDGGKSLLGGQLGSSSLDAVSVSSDEAQNRGDVCMEGGSNAGMYRRMPTAVMGGEGNLLLLSEDEADIL